jgi:hypothetical protein
MGGGAKGEISWALEFGMQVQNKAKREVRVESFALVARFKEESHAARWGLMRGYSGKATKWVDFVKAGSTQRKREEPCPRKNVLILQGGVKLFRWRIRTANLDQKRPSLPCGSGLSYFTSVPAKGSRGGR